MRLSLPVYVLMIMWSLVGGIFRVVLLIQHGYPVDILPVVTLTLGFSGLADLIIERRPHPAIYFLLAGWMPVGSALRIASQIMQGQALDPLPAVSLILASTAFTMFFIAARQPHEVEGDSR